MFNIFNPKMTPLEREIKERQEHKKALNEMEKFKACITGIVENYIKMIDMKISAQDKKIETTISEINENLNDVATAELNKALEDGRITITATYDPETESLIIGGGVNG